LGANTSQHGDNRDLRSIIDRAARTVYVTQLLLGILVWTAICAGLWMALFALDNLLRFPPAMRFPLSLGGVAITLIALWRYIISTALGKKTHDQIAVMLERKYAIADNVVINALQFGGGEFAEAQRPFVERTMAIGAKNLGVVSLRDFGESGRLVKWAGAVAIAVLLMGCYIGIAPQYFDNAMSRYFFSLSDVPPASSLTLQVTPGSDISVAETEDVEVSVMISGLKPDQRLEKYPELYWKEGLDEISPVRGAGSRVVMHPVMDEKNTYRHKFVSVRSSFSFRLFAADAHSRSIRVKVAPAPRIETSQCRVTSPWYTGSRVTSVLGPPNPVECLPDSQLRVEVEMNKQCRALFWRTADGVLDFNRTGDKWQVQSRVKRGGPYDVEAQADDLNKRIVVASGVVSLLADEQPSIDILDAVANRTVTPGEVIRLKVRGHDHYGLRDIRITVRPALGGVEPRTLRTWRYGDSRIVKVEGREFDRTEIESVLCEQIGEGADRESVNRAVEHFTSIRNGLVQVDFPPGNNDVVHETIQIPIDASIFEPGYKYFIEAVARDFCPNNEASVSKAIMVTVRSVDDLRTPKNSDLSELYDYLDKAIKYQKLALGNCETLMTHAEDVWLDMNRKPYEAKKVQALLGMHRRTIQKNQGQVHQLLSRAWQSTRDRSLLVTRIKEISENEAVDANDRASRLNGVRCDLGLGRPVHRGRLDYTQDGHAIGLKRTTRGRYLGFVIDSATRWDDNSSLARLSLQGADGKDIPFDGWKVTATRGGSKIKLNAEAWTGAGPLPHFLVVDMGKVNEVSKIKISRDMTSVARFKLYLAESWPGKVDVPDMPDMSIMLRDAGSLKRVQETIYNQLIALKGKEVVKAEKEEKEAAERALLGEGVESAPTPDEALQNLRDEIKEWKVRHEENAELRATLMNKLPEDFSDKDAESLDAAIAEKVLQARELKDFVNNFTATAGMDEGDSQQAKVKAEILTKLDELRNLENEAVAIAKGGDFTESLDDQITMAAEGVAGKSKKDEDAKSADVPGGAEQPEDSGIPPYAPSLANELSTTVDELASKLESISEDLSYSATVMSGALGTNPQDNIVGGQYSSMASAGQMGDITPDPMKNAAGRSGAGRSGQSDGQFTGDSAPRIPDDEVAMPNRMSDGASEEGKDIKDQHSAPPTSVGMGKNTTRTTDFGKSGKMPPELMKKLRAVGQEAESFEESCQDMLMELNRHNLPDTDLKMAMLRMRGLREAMRKGDGEGIRQAFDAAVKHIKLGQLAIVKELEQRAAGNEDWEMQRDHVSRKVLRDLKGYEEMIGEYFKKLAENKEE
jgi:hypothetical protein